MNSIARLVSAAFATVSAWSCVPTCDSTSDSSVFDEVNFETSVPGFLPGTFHSSSPFLALPVISAFPVVSQAPTSTEAAGLRKLAVGRKVLRSSPKVKVQSSVEESSGRSK